MTSKGTTERCPTCDRYNCMIAEHVYQRTIGASLSAPSAPTVCHFERKKFTSDGTQNDAEMTNADPEPVRELVEALREMVISTSCLDGKINSGARYRKALAEAERVLARYQK